MENNPFDKLEKSNEKKTKKSDKTQDSIPAVNESSKTEEKAEKPEKQEPPLEKLSTEEKHLVAQEIVEQRKDEVSQELEAAEPNTPEESESITGATFIEILDAELAAGTDLDQALEIAEQETLAVAGLDEQENERVEANEIVVDRQEHQADDSNESETDEEDTEPMISTGGGSGGSGTPPTSVAASPAPLPNGEGGNAYVPPTSGGISQHNQLPTQTIGNTYGNKHAARKAFFAGGVVGYLIGRRRGRIKTEAKLLPVQKNLEKEVKTLQTTIIEREQKIRAHTTQVVSRNPEAPKQMLERIHVLQEFKYPERYPESPESPKRLAAKPESVGKLALKIREAQNETPLKPVDQMQLSEVLVVAQKINTEDSNLKRLFETGRIKENGLRRIVKEYLRGEKYDSLLVRELRSPEKITEKAYPEHGASQVFFENQSDTNIAASRNDESINEIIKSPQAGISTQPEPVKKPNRTAVVTALIVLAIILLFVLL